MRYEVTYYPKLEERLNIISHGLGAILSIIAFPLLVLKAMHSNDTIVVLSVVIYGLSLIILYSASTLYHATDEKRSRYYLNIFDHSAIYVLIAGTYAPVALVVLQGRIGWVIFGLSWFFAILGVLFKVFFIGRFKLISIGTYIAMGWMIVFAINPLVENFDKLGLMLFVYGGVSYSIGALFFALKKVPYNHAIFHGFVLFGSLFHFLGIYFYIL